MATIAVSDRLTQTWASRPGILGWLSVVNHKQVGRRYMVTAFIFFLLAGRDALRMRTQLAQPQMDFLSPREYNELFTMHGTVMMFIFIVPILEGLAGYLTPLMIGSRDLIFPRLNSFGYWCFLFGGIFLYSSLITDNVPDSGWFAYVPLSGSEFSPGKRMDYWLLGITFVEISTIVAAIDLIASIVKSRAPGMSLNRMPLFVWSVLVMAFMILIGFLPLVAGSVLLELDRTFGAQFYNPAAGGNVLLWQHYFWLFGHPEVYVMLLPALGIISMIIPTFTRRPIIGYPIIVLALVAIGFLSFGLWVHHMYTTGLPPLALNVFAAASMLITFANGANIFAWIATIWGGRLVIKTPFLWILGFFFIFVIGGITGVMVGSVAFDEQVHDTQFIVAHLHYVIIGGVVFPLFAAFHYWFPKVTGRMLSESLGHVSFWFVFIGTNLAFFPQHLAGLQGMPRRVYTYSPELGVGLWNLLSTIGAYVSAFGVVIFIINVVWSHIRGERAGDNPWGAGSLEWATTSPPPPYNFRVIPAISSREPLWAQPEIADLGREHEQAMLTARQSGEAAKTDLAPGRRETYGTTLADAIPEQIITLPSPSLWPLVLAMGVAVFLASLLTGFYLAMGVGILIGLVAVAGWHWPSKELTA